MTQTREQYRAWYPKSQRKRRRYLTDYERRCVRHLVIECGETVAEVARTMGISYSTAYGIVSGRTKPYRPSGAAVPRRIPTAEKQD